MPHPFFAAAAITTAALLFGAAVLHLLPRLGPAGRRASDALCRAPALDIMITYFTVAPLIVAPILTGWRGFLGAILGQVAAVLIWTALHELAHPAARRGPRIVKFNNALVGRWRNHAALWVMAPAAPLLWLVRVTEILIYTPLTWLVALPKYPSGDWVNLSRQKFTGLVGHDLIWCLYCDWMTGIWSLGSEMLRNIESFWCPIRFYSDKKCANCAVDFPDINTGWTPANATMADVADTLHRHYDQPPHAWFGHPIRLTVKGAAIDVTSETNVVA